MTSRPKLGLASLLLLALVTAPVWPGHGPASHSQRNPAAEASATAAPPPPPPQSQVDPKEQIKREKAEAKAVVETSKALDDLVCDNRLLNELTLNLTGVHCITHFDHRCTTIWGAVLAANGVAVGAKNLGADLLDGKKNYARAEEAARNLIKGGKASESFAEIYERLSKQQAESVGGKYFTQEQMRKIGIAELDRAATTGEMKAVSAALAKATSRSTRAAAVRAGAKVLGYGILPLSGIMATVSFLSDSGNIPCESSSRVDLVPDDQGQGCRFSFDKNGPKFRQFMNETRDRQLDIIRRDKVSCRYLNVINEQLKGNLISQGQILSQVKYTELPSCPTNGKGTSYNVQLPAEPTGPFDKTESSESFQIASEPFADGKSLRTVTVKELGQSSGLKDVKFIFEQGTIPKYVETTDDYPGAFPTRVPIEDFRRRIEGSGAGNTKVRKALRALGVSTYWTPIIAQCCPQPEADRAECWKKVLPGLKGVAVKAAEADQPIPQTKPIDAKSADATPAGQK